MPEKKLRRKRCKVCKAYYEPRSTTQTSCSPVCALKYVGIQREKDAKKAQREAKQRIRDNDRSFRLKQAQAAFNTFIRMRDDDLPCVSCGRWHQGQWHASHYRPTGQNSALRFNEINCHRACSVCNNHHSGNLIPYREELVRRIGLPLVEWLEKDHPKVQAWSCEELKAIEAYYKRAVKEMYASPEHTPFPF